jgi:hypothetical protein
MQAQGLLRLLVQLLQQRGCVLQPVWIPSEQNPADAPSRECLVETPIRVSRRGKDLLRELAQSEPVLPGPPSDQPTPQEQLKLCALVAPLF